MRPRRGERPAQSTPTVRQQIAGQEIDTPKGTPDVNCPMACSTPCAWTCPRIATSQTDLQVSDGRTPEDVPANSRPATPEEAARFHRDHGGSLLDDLALEVRIDLSDGAWLVRPTRVPWDVST